MDGTQPQPRERSQPPFQRAASRTSTRTNTSRSTSNSANTSAQLSSSSPRLAHAHTTHRYHHAACARSANSPQLSGRSTPQLSRESSLEPAAISTASTFLQEKLQRERRAHSDRVAGAATRSKTDLDMSASMELTPSRSGSLAISREADGSRPWSSGGDASKQRGMGLREMEQSMSDMHKMNWNLKVEVSKRRDAQIQLEARLEDLEAKQAEMEDMNDRLLKELEKRDAAVEEAVAHIVRLEAEVEQLRDEKLRQGQDIFPPGHYPDYRSPTPKASTPMLAKLKEDPRVINRMPSFLSEQTEDTETLRKVYLSLNGSALTLPRVRERSTEDDMVAASGLPSPTALSTLSESSFVSIYGQRGASKTALSGSLEPLTYNGVEARSRTVAPGDVSRAMTTRSASANIEAKANRQARAYASGQYPSLVDIIGQGSPLQRLERDPHHAARRETPRPPSQCLDAAGVHLTQPARSPGRRRTKDEKREALRRVMTDAPGGVRLHDHNMPPTPDTISTTTLRRFKNSNDTLAPANDSSSDPSRSQDGLATLVDKDDDPFDHHVGASLRTKPALAGAPMALKDFAGSSYFDFASPNSQRPYSADDTTISHRRGNGWYSDDEAEPDAPSIESSDIWMQESGRINRDEGRISPDLFGFPGNGPRGGWATDAMFGPGAQIGGVSLHPDVQDMFTMQQGAWSADAPPPPPNRRSSLHARTGSRSAATSTEHSPTKTSAQHSPSRRQKGQQRRNSDDPHLRTTAQNHPQPQFYQPAAPTSSDQKRNHYPPIAGQQGARAGLNRLFRRSLSIGSGNKPDAPAPAPALEAFQDDQGSMGVPSWVGRSGVMDDDRSGATPPPILRNPRHVRADSWHEDEEVMAEGGSSVVEANGGRRKWLPSFGRSSSLRNRN